MKKPVFILLICFIIPCLFANDNGLSMTDRSWEIGIMHTDFGFSNSFLNITDIFKETVVLDIDKFYDGFFLNLNLGVTPLYVSFNSRKGWGFGFFAGSDTAGHLGLSGKMLTFNDAINDKSNFGISAFVHAQFSGFFHVSELMIKLAPSVYYPLAYAQSSVFYTKNNTDQGTVLNLDYKMQFFSAMSMNPAGSGEITGSPGLDISFGAEYPLAKAIGLKEKINFFDFSLGFDVYNFPVVPAQLQDFMLIAGRIGSDTPIDILNTGLPDDFIAMDDIIYGIEPKAVKRPFKFFLWSDWRPFGFLGITPAIGFALNDVYIDTFSFEGSLKARFDLASIFIATVGLGYYDRVWVNSLDLALNFRAFELNLGLNLRSNKFTENWLNGSPGAQIGIKFGW